MTEIYVSNEAELMKALSSADGGDTILLEAGNYGAVDLRNIKFNDYVTIKSADANNRAVLQEVEFGNSSYIRIDGVKVEKGPEAGAKLVEINSSDNISIMNSEIIGDGAREGTYGIYAKDGNTNLQIDNNYVHHVGVGITIFSTTGVEVTENLVDYISYDFYKGGSITNGLWENNVGGGHLFPTPEAHADFLQFQGSATDVVFRGNVYLAQNNERAQGIFLDDATYTNILIEQNIIYSGKYNSIFVLEGSGITVRDNTLLTTPDLGHNAAGIRVPSGTVVENNLYTHLNGGTSGSNVVAQWDDENDINHYNDLFVNADKGLGVTLEDLRPIEGSLAETHGAYDRLMELLNGTSSNNPGTTNPGTGSGDYIDDGSEGSGSSGSEVDDAGEAGGGGSSEQGSIDTNQIEGTAFSMLGTKSISRASDVVEVAHNKDMELTSGTISLSFKADTVSGKMGLISKDASYYVGGGNHFAAYIDNGTLVVRFQDGAGDEIARIDGIMANTDYDLQISFGNDTVGIWLDGEQVHTADFSMDWANNVEHFQVGALGWASQSGQGGFKNVFDGGISDVVIVEGKWSPQQMKDFIYDSKPLPDENSGTTDPDVTDPGTTDPDVTDPGNPAGENNVNAVFEADEVEFYGRKSNIVNLEHDSDLELAEGTIAFTFNADDLKGTQGLLSKDASHYVGGGNHLSVMLKGDDLVLRFQDEDSDAYLTFDGVNANEDYDVQTWFGDGKIGLAVNGQLVAVKDFDFELTSNQQNLQLGGLGWGSSDGGSEVTRAFDGTMTEVAIYDQVLPLDSGDLIV